MSTTKLFEVRGARLIAAAVTTLAALAVSLLLAPGFAHAKEVSLSIEGAGKITEVSDRNLIASDCENGRLQSPNTTPTFQVGASCSPGSPDGPYNNGDFIAYRAEPLPGFHFAHWRTNHADGSNYTPVRCAGMENGSSYWGNEYCRFQIFENVKLKAIFYDNTPPPGATITGPTKPVKDFASFRLGLSSPDPTFKQFECQVEDVNGRLVASNQVCDTPFSLDVRGGGYTDGTYRLTVYSRDHSGNRSMPNSGGDFRVSNVLFTVDKTAPETTLDASAGPAEGSTGVSGDASFAFSSSEPTNATFECSLDNAAFSPCNSPGTSTTKSYVGLREGPHSFRVRAVDQAGSADATPAVRTWTVDNNTDPETTLAPSGPTGTTNITSASFAFSSEAGATFECSLDGAAFSTCSSPTGYTVTNGSHTFSVRAKDGAGNVDATPAVRTWTVDALKPTVGAMSPRHTSTIRDTTPTIKATVRDDLADLQEADVKLYVAGKLISPTKYGYDASTDALLYNSPRLSRGKKTVKVVATDAAGNIGTKSWYFTIG